MIKSRPLTFVCLLILMIWGIILLITGGKFLMKTPAGSLFYEQNKESVTIRGQVYKKTITSKYQIYYLRNNSTDDSKIIIYDSQFMNIPIGKIITIQGTLGFFEHARNPGNFDQKLYYAKQKIYGVVWMDELVNITGKRNYIAETLYQIKSYLKDSFVKFLGEKNGGVLATMLLGDKEFLDAEMRELYQNNGVAHILAISGIHISFLGLGIYRLFRKMGISFISSGILSMTLLGLYICMTGITVSSFRACFMLLLKIMADMTGRIYDMMTATLLGAAITVCYQPLYLLDAGFYMSYGAILGILLVLPVLKTSFPCRNKLLESAYASIAINVTLFPIMLWFYYVFSTYSVILNFIVLPFVGVLMGTGIISSVTLAFSPLIGGTIIKICGWILTFYEFVCRQGNKLPCSKIVLGQPKWWNVILYYSLLIIICITLYNRKKQKRKWIWILLLIPIGMMAYMPSSGMQVTMLDVGQGDGMFILGPKKMSCFIDGGSSDVNQVGRYRMEPFLLSQGIGTLEYVFLTHGDGDHCSGIEELIDRQELGVRIKRILVPANYKKDEKLSVLVKKAIAKGIEVYIMNGGDCIEKNEMRITCVQPNQTDTGLEGNAGSMVLEISYKNFSMLCTGDVEGEGEVSLIQRIKYKRYSVLKVSHHGSKNSTSEEFLTCTRPTIALISAGIDNSYQHPHKEVLERLKKYKSIIYNTQKNGAITIRTDGNSLTIR